MPVSQEGKSCSALADGCPIFVPSAFTLQTTEQPSSVTLCPGVFRGTEATNPLPGGV